MSGVRSRALGPPLRLFAVLLAAGVATTVSCASTDNGATQVRIAIGGQTQMVYLPTTLAQALGYYEAEGLDVELQDFEGGAKALQALIGGSADVVSGYYDHTIQMAAEGREFVAFVTMLRYPGLVLVTSPQAAQRIAEVPALEGGIAGVTSVGSSSHMFLVHLLTRHKVPVESVSVTGIGSGATAIAAIERGRVDAGWMADPGFTLVRKRNPGVPSPGRLARRTRHFRGVRDHHLPERGAVHGCGWLTANRGTAVRLTRAILRTLDWMRTHSEEDIAARTPAALRGEDAGLYVEALKNSRHMFSTDGVMPAEGAAAVRNVLAMSMDKVRRATIDLSKTYTNEFVAER